MTLHTFEVNIKIFFLSSAVAILVILRLQALLPNKPYQLNKNLIPLTQDEIRPVITTTSARKSPAILKVKFKFYCSLRL